ncbi:MAG: polyprenyl synthetase family protein [Clostridium sp.]|nr:polyprenyl synthetase family protein [Prevotella sp.]MCM1429679.1 polyprenyl synthetase family protein [Clostridium sp.]MCM1476166.1 polyprenyl synthetase family protein [Muribaculaceae bacterium]
MNQLDNIQHRLEGDLREMNDIIHRSLATSNQLMNDIVGNYLKTKGKQIRPILVMLSAKFFGDVNEDVLHAGAALEMLHNASLIHDDIVDETTLRRGNPTVNAIWGNHIAVLVGDFFVSNALSAGIRTGHLSIIAALSDLGKELSLGEIDQICNARDHHFDEESYFSMIQKKTASLFMNCVRMGAEAVNAEEVKIVPMVEYARLLGICFQIKDDIFDYFDNPRIGKPTGNDLREGKMTLPLLYALRSAPDDTAEHYRNILRRGNLTDAEISDIIEFAKANGGIEYSYDTMRQMQHRADEIISSYPDSEWKTSFRDLFDFIISREV